MRVFPMTVLVALLAPGASAPAHAQQRAWFAEVHAVPVAFGAGASAVEPAPGEIPEFGPAHDLRGSAAVGRRLGRWEVALGGSYGKHGLRGGNGSGWVTVEPGYTLATADATCAYALLDTQGGVRLQAFAGPTLMFWSGDAVAGSRTRMGARGGLQLIAPVADWLSVDTRAALGLAGSPVTQEELSDLSTSYATGALWSRELGVGLRVTF